MTEPTPSSPQELFAAVRAARAGSIPISPALPDLSFGTPDSGLLDLMVVVEQVIRSSGGVTVAQALHAAVYLLAMAHENILQEIPVLREQLEKQQPEGSRISDAAVHIAQRRFEVEAAQLKNCVSVIAGLLELPTTAFVQQRVAREEVLLNGDDQSQRKAALKALVGRPILESLELDPEAYYGFMSDRT